MVNTGNARKWLYFNVLNLRGMPAGKNYHRYLEEDRAGVQSGTNKNLLIELLSHCKQKVPYYRSIMQELGDSYFEDPVEYIAQFPVLTKKDVREQFEQLKSSDLQERKWFLNSTGGSTGDNLEFIQDREYSAKAGAIKSLYATLAGCDVGERQDLFWASLHEIDGVTEGWKHKLMNWFANTSIHRTNHLNPEVIRDYISLLNKKKPQLIVGYVWVLNEIAKFVEHENLHVEKQNAVMSSAGTLYPSIRQTLERVFQCNVYNRYGSREVGDIACERPGYDGLWVAPWGNYVEAVDADGKRLPDGTEGDLLITSLTNYAMPLIRYQIGDRGILATSGSSARRSQVLQAVTGRTIDRFYNRWGKSIESGFFMVLFYHRNWVEKYQVVQKTPSHIQVKLVVNGKNPPDNEIEEIISKGKSIMGDENCEIEIKFVPGIETDPSGKYRFIRSEVEQE